MKTIAMNEARSTLYLESIGFVGKDKKRCSFCPGDARTCAIFEARIASAEYAFV